MEAILTGEPIPAQRAYDLGLMDAWPSPVTPSPEARRLADQICLNAPLAIWESRGAVVACVLRGRRDAQGA